LLAIRCRFILAVLFPLHQVCNMQCGSLTRRQVTLLSPGRGNLANKQAIQTAAVSSATLKCERAFSQVIRSVGNNILHLVLPNNFM